VWLLLAAAFGLDVPAGTEIQIRLKNKISSQNARVNDPVEAVVIAPAMELVDRPNVPQHAQNATGDNLETDGKIAVVVLW